MQIPKSSIIDEVEASIVWSIGDIDVIATTSVNVMIHGWCSIGFNNVVEIGYIRYPWRQLNRSG